LQKILDFQSQLNNSCTKEELESMNKELQRIQMGYQIKMANRSILVDDTLRIFFEIINKNERYILEKLRVFE
jgi:hypothetical protein